MYAAAAILALLRDTETVTDVLGDAPLRVFTGVIPDHNKDYPAAAISTVSINPHSTFDGNTNHEGERVDIRVFATTQTEADSVGKLIRKALENRKGTFGGVEVTRIRMVDSGTDGFAELADKKMRQLEFQVKYNQE